MNTAAEIISAARTYVLDKQPGAYRHDDATLLNWLRGGVADLRRGRRDLFIGRQTFDMSRIGMTTDLTWLDFTWRQQLAQMVAMHWLSVDDEAALDAGKLGVFAQLGGRK